MTDIFIVAGVRTAIGSFGGALKEVSPSTMVAAVTREAVRRAAVAPEQVGLSVFGQVIATEPRDIYISRIAVIEGGLGQETPALTVNRLCGSGLQAILTAANAIRAGEAEVALAGGVEAMSRAPHLLPAVRRGRKMGDVVAVDAMLAALHDPFCGIHMGVTAEELAASYSISREQQDALALESHRRASTAIREGLLRGQILGIETRCKVFDTDEHVRHDATLESLAALPPAFGRDGTVTAGNSSGINDGAAAVVLASGEAVRRLGLVPLARLVAAGHAGVDPRRMGIGPVPATRQALGRAGLAIGDLDVIEANEAFAAQALAVARELDFDPARVNPNGSGISLGHPVGATGAILAVKLVYELQRSGGRMGLVTMCIGGGQGIAAVVERT